MKNSEIIQIAAMVVLAAALIYRKYGKNKKAGETTDHKMPAKSHSSDDDYEPYSKNNNNK